MTTQKLRKNDVRPILRAIGHEDTKVRRFEARVQPTYTLNNGDLIWQGGSKTEITFLRQTPKGWDCVDAADALPCAATDRAVTVSGPIPADVMIVEHWHFGGAEGFTFVVSPVSTFLPKAIGAESVAGMIG